MITADDLARTPVRAVAHIHMQGGYGWMYEFETVPRLKVLIENIRTGKRAGERRTYVVDNIACRDLACAIARLNGQEEPPVMTKPISLAQQIEELQYELGQRARVYPGIERKDPRRASENAYHVARMTAALATLSWLAEHEALIKQRLA